MHIRRVWEKDNYLHLDVREGGGKVLAVVPVERFEKEAHLHLDGPCRLHLDGWRGSK